jgi:uncharacterized membrane protein
LELMMMSGQRARANRGRHPLGWLSVGLGGLTLAAPRLVQRMSGLDDSAATRRVLSFVGARELLHGVGLLGSRRTAGWAWSRVAGDAVDLATLAVALSRRQGSGRNRLAAVSGAVMAITVMDVVGAVRARRSPGGRAMELTATTTVRRPRSEVYAFWRRLENLPGFMAHLDDVVAIDDRRSHWTATAPFGRTVSWDAELTLDEPETRIAWRSVGRSAVPNRGSVTFATAPDPVSTEVHVRLSYDVPAGRLGRSVARYFGEEPHQQVDDDLRRFKQVMETGQVMRSDGALWGKRSRHEFPQRPAQPPGADQLMRVVAA